ncbi:MerC domain-containing protein [Algiphilus sp.]|uniref:MerC domain-containing protein n=1 Tax=Algiphilus sp. TaxID=1872431 RepID=UPI002A5B25A8|nr:MerC domain-containing protein [Pseudomonadota bacterium]
MKKESLHRAGWLDAYGISLTSLCAVHCLLLPLWPLLGMTLLADPRVEQWALMVSMVIAVIAIGHGVCMHHRKALPLLMMLAGFGLYLSKGMLGEGVEPLILTLGAALVAGAHWLNLRCGRVEAAQ